MAVPTTVPCPTCRRKTAWEGNPNRPFCSDRCRLHDLGNWAGERYRIPVAPAPEDGSEDDDASEE